MILPPDASPADLNLRCCKCHLFATLRGGLRLLGLRLKPTGNFVVLKQSVGNIGGWSRSWARRFLTAYLLLLS
jgi:hypothetical protein